MFRKVSLLFGLLTTVLLATVACQPVQPVSAMKAQAAVTTREENQAVVQSFYDTVNQRNFDALKEIFDANMVAHELGFGPLLKDTELWIGFPDQQITVDLWVIEGDLVTAVATVSGTHQGEFMGVAPTGKPMTFTIIDIWRVKDGKIAEVWHNAPNADILQQVGYQLVPPAK